MNTDGQKVYDDLLYNDQLLDIRPTPERKTPGIFCKSRIGNDRPTITETVCTGR